MSRRHHGRSRHARGRSDDGSRLQAQIVPRPETHPAPSVEPRPDAPAFDARTEAGETGTVPGDGATGLQAAAPHVPPQATLPNAAAPNAVVPQAAPVNGNGHAPHTRDATDMNGGERAGCTAPQLRRFIKSRPYVPMHELRRRFGINGAEDEVSALPIEDASVYVGLPERECRLLGELVRGGEVGYELSLDPRTPIVVGVYPMRPVPRA
jgi:hypothetical protein